MSDNFNENLSMFLISCRESALKELTENNSEYKSLLSDVTKLSEKVQEALLEEYETLTDKFNALMRIEINYLYLRGFKDCIRLYKRLDGSFAESQDFEKFFT